MLKQMSILTIILIALTTPLAAEDSATTTAAAPAMATAFDPQPFLMSEEEEIHMASTAGPPEISKDASFYVLRKDRGYEKVKDGSNGFHCFVERSWSGPTPKRLPDPRVRAPHCINNEGSHTTMQEIFMATKLGMEGKSSDEIDAVLDRAYRDGALKLPVDLSMTYMMSKHQWLAEGIEAWHPHMMFWIPYLTEQKVGPITKLTTKNAVLAWAGSRRSVLVVRVPDWIE